MMKREFEELVKKAQGRTNDIGLKDTDWETIETVYTWHPAISETKGKDQITRLFVDYGMLIIRDMYPTAIRALELQDTENMTLQKMDDIRTEYDRDIVARRERKDQDIADTQKVLDDIRETRRALYMR